MADPTKYIVSYDFTNLPAANDAPRLNNELANIQTSISQVVEAIKDIRRSDGKLNNGIVHEESLAPDFDVDLNAEIVVENRKLAEAAAASAAASAESIGKPIYVVATGQSNTTIHLPYAWVPPDNLKGLWNWDGFVNIDTDIGNKFEPINNRMALVYSAAAQIARDNPTRPVYCATFSKGSLPIAYWLPSPPPTYPNANMWTVLTNNMPPSLAKIKAETGMDPDVKYIWWQGEGNVRERQNNSQYLDLFRQLRARLKTQTWFDPQAPMIIHGVNARLPQYSYYDSIGFNGVLQRCAADEPNVLTYVHTMDIPDVSPANGDIYWLHATNVNDPHMTALGYKLAGELDALTLSGEGKRASAFKNSFDPTWGYHQTPNPVFFAPIEVVSGPVSGVAAGQDITTGYSTVYFRGVAATVSGGEHFDIASGTFRAPIEGWYRFGYKLGNSSGSTLIAQIKIFTNEAPSGALVVGSQGTTSTAGATINGECIVYLRANEAARLTMTNGTTFGNANNNVFFGSLIG